MKKIMIAVMLTVCTFSTSTEAAEFEISNGLEIQELGAWTHFRDKYLLGRDTDKKEEHHRHHHAPPPPPKYHHHHHDR